MTTTHRFMGRCLHLITSIWKAETSPLKIATTNSNKQSHCLCAPVLCVFELCESEQNKVNFSISIQAELNKP